MSKTALTASVKNTFAASLFSGVTDPVVQSPHDLKKRAPRLYSALEDLSSAMSLVVTSWIRSSPSHSRGGAIDVAFRLPGMAKPDYSRISLTRLSDTLRLLKRYALKYPDLIWMVENTHLHLQDPKVSPSPHHIPGALLIQADALTSEDISTYVSAGGRVLHFPAFEAIII